MRTRSSGFNALESYHEGTAPTWERPADPILWTCSGCGVNVIRDLEDGEIEYELPVGAKGHKWYNSHPYRNGCPEKTPFHTFGEGDKAQPVCEFCADNCAHCGARVSSLIETFDVYDDGWCTTLPDTDHCDVFCVECVSAQCDKCGGFFTDGRYNMCSCEEDDDEGDDDGYPMTDKYDVT